ncbi:hypothetical protein DL98DRAFT_510217 [Cadophora sp. DSE1049]|nr:hypothetical protein DL98DRAFT_510217 [Cadophora sp. DSE1049]
MAFLPDDTPPPDPTEHRLLQYSYTPEDIKTYHDLTIDMSDSRDTDSNGGRLICAKRHIRRVLHEAGLPVSKFEKTEYDDGDYSGWDVVEDGSIEKPDDTTYGYFQIEIRSPAYYFTPQALNEVRLACQALTDNFCVLAVETSSLHVHVGDGERSFDTETMRRLEAFLWAFEPQLQSIHPPHRQCTYYATSLRASSKYSCAYQETYDRIPDGITGALDLYDFRDIESLRDQVIDVSGYLKNSQVSICGIASAVTDPSHAKKTVEWRQHEGTLDGEQVANWISTVVGAMCFVRDAPVGYFFDVVSFALFETWQKTGDGRDEQREEEYGPILAEGHFPINKLLRLLMLDEQAKYYRDHWYILPKTRPKDAKKSRIVWDYERELVPGSKEYQRCYRFRRLWEDLRILKDEPLCRSLVFDPESSMWPSHRLRSRGDSLSEVEAMDDGDAESEFVREEDITLLERVVIVMEEMEENIGSGDESEGDGNEC